jgi:hypothetical protein
VSDSTLGGNRRTEDVTGKSVGPYVVVGPVGSNWRTSVYWVLKCRVCGAIRNVQRKQFGAFSNHKNCSVCHSATLHGGRGGEGNSSAGT